MTNKAPMTNDQGDTVHALVIGHWSFVGHWDLDLGHFTVTA
jgi:hypothetical protein